jgi:hypothetical protein
MLRSGQVRIAFKAAASGNIYERTLRRHVPILVADIVRQWYELRPEFNGQVRVNTTLAQRNRCHFMDALYTPPPML